jgi:hypothetical protein
METEGDRERGGPDPRGPASPTAASRHGPLGSARASARTPTPPRSESRARAAASKVTMIEPSVDPRTGGGARATGSPHLLSAPAESSLSRLSAPAESSLAAGSQRLLRALSACACSPRQLQLRCSSTLYSGDRERHARLEPGPNQHEACDKAGIYIYIYIHNIIYI